MICELTEMDLQNAFRFCWEVCKNPEKNSYPIYPEPGDLQNAMIGAFQDKQDKLLGCFEKEELIGVFMLFPIQEDHFLQTNGFFIEGDFAIAADQFLRYLKKKYPGYRALFGFPRENKYAGMYFFEKNIKCIESSYTLLCERAHFQKEEASKLKGVTRVTEKDFDEYAPFHDLYAGEIYWKSDRIKRDLTSWWIYTYKKKNEIVGALFMHVENKCDAEIFGVFVKEGEDIRKVCRKILSVTLDEVFKQYPKVGDVLYFVEEESLEELRAAYDTGFLKKDHYRCFELML